MKRQQGSSGSPSRQARRKAHKAQRRAKRERTQRGVRQVKAGQAKGQIKAAPQARGYLVQQFWQHLRLGELLHQAGVKQKFKGLAATSLMLVALLFGVCDAHSVSDLTTKVRVDPVVLELCAVQELERKQLYRFLGQIKDETYLAWLGEIIGELNRDPRTATRRSGVVIGDDTVVFRFGVKMPYVTLVFKASGARFGLGNIIVSTHYADTQKDFSLFFDFWRPTPQQIAAAQNKRERKRLKIDQRKPDDMARWLEHQVKEGRTPDLVLLHGSQVGVVVVGKCEALNLIWVGVASGKRQYMVVRPNGTPISGDAADLRERNYRPSDWIELTDVGYRIVLVGDAQLKGLGPVSLVLAEDMTDQERTLLVTRAGEAPVLLPRVELALAQSTEVDTSRLNVMLALLKRTRQAGVLAETAVFDRWFYVLDFIGQVLALGFARVIIKAKRSMTYTYHGQDYALDDLWRFIPAKHFRRKCLRGRWVKLAALHVTHGQLGHVKLVFVKELGPHNTILHAYALMCTDPHFRNDHVYCAHKLRWKIEEGYREVRQNHGLEQYHARNFNTNFGHVALSFLSYLCLVVTRLLTTKLRHETLGQIKQRMFQALVELEWVDEILHINFEPQFWREIGLPAYCG